MNDAEVLALGHPRPDVDRALGRIDAQADLPQRGHQHVAAALVDRAHLRHRRLVRAQRRRRGLLERLEHAAVDVRLELPVGADEVAVADHRARPPAGHVVGLGEGEDLDADVQRAGGLEERGRPVAVVGDLRVGVVVDDDHVVAAGELDDAREEVVVDHAAGGVVRVVEEHEPRRGGHLRRDGLEVREEAQLRDQRHRHRVGARQQRPRRVDRVARVAGERDVARVEERQVDVRHGLLGAQRGDDLGRGVEVHAEARRVEARHGLAEALPGPGWTGTGGCRGAPPARASPRPPRPGWACRGRRCRAR